MCLVDWAEQVASQHLSEVLPQRWAHVVAVAGRSASLASRLDHDGELLHAASWLHDVGYAPSLAGSGFHPLDGATFLRSVDAPARLVDLVAFHSSAASEAAYFGVADQLEEFSDERSLVRDLLWFADMTTGPDGQCMSFPERMDEVRERYGPDHYVVRALDAGMAEREAAVRRAEEWIKSVGLEGQV